jgi:homoserine kinase type II
MLKNTSTLNHYIQKNIPSQEKYSAMPRLAVHGDYHPGNLKFQGGKVIAVLDFGWSKIEARCFDVGL